MPSTGKLFFFGNNKIPSSTRPGAREGDTDSKTKTLAKLAFSDIGKAATNSNFLKTAAVVVITTIVASVLVGALLTPPGWILAAAAVSALVISLGIRWYLDPKTKREISPLRQLGFDEIVKNKPNKFSPEQQKAIRDLSEKTSINLIPKRSNFGKIYLGTLPNKLSPTQRKLFEEGNVGKVLSIIEDKELKPEGLSIPWTEDEFKTADITQKTISVKDHELLTIEELNKAADEIYDTISQEKDIYVHCKAGQGRSPVTIAAYLIKYEGYTVDEAIDCVEVNRKIANLRKKGREERLREFADQCPIPPLKIDWNSEYTSNIENQKTPDIFFKDKINKLIERGNKITIREKEASTLLTLDNYENQLQNIPPHILMSLTESIPGSIYMSLQKTRSTIQMDSSFSTPITLTKLENSFKVKGEFSISRSAANDPDTLKSLHHISYSTSIPTVLDLNNPSIAVACHEKPASKLELFLCKKQREFQSTVDKKTIDCQEFIISSKFNHSHLSKEEETNLRQMISTFLSKRTSFELTTDLLVEDFLKEYPDIKNSIKDPNIGEDPNTLKYTTAANKIHSYEKGVVLPIKVQIKHHSSLQKLISEPEKHLETLHANIILDLERNTSITLEKENISTNLDLKEDLKPQLRDVPLHIQYFLYQSLQGIILSKISNDSTLKNLKIQPTRDNSSKTPLSMHVKKIDSDYILTTNFDVKYIDDENPLRAPFDYAKYSCKVTIPYTIDLNSTEIPIQLEFTATPIEEPIAVKS